MSSAGRNENRGSGTRCRATHVFQTTIPQLRMARSKSESFSDFAVRPVKPRQKSLHVGRIHRRAAPDTQARGRIAIRADIERHAFFIEQRNQRLRVLLLRVGGQRRVSRIFDHETDRRVRARRRILREETRPVGFRDPVFNRFQIRLRTGDQAGQSADAIPPTCRPSSASSTHSSEGVLIVSPTKMPAISLPPLVIWKIFGSGRSGV